MENIRFKQFVEDVYEATKDRTMDDKILGIPIKRKSFYGRVYIANSSPSFMDIEESFQDEKPMHKFLDSYRITPDMLHIHSHVNDAQEDIYEHEYVSHQILNDKIVVEMKRKKVEFAI